MHCKRVGDGFAEASRRQCGGTAESSGAWALARASGSLRFTTCMSGSDAPLFPANAAALLRTAVNQTHDPDVLKAMLLYVADNLEKAALGAPCVFCPMLHGGLSRSGPPCVL